MAQNRPNEMTALVDGHEISIVAKDGKVMARVGYIDGSDWPGEFDAAQWEHFSLQVSSLIAYVQEQWTDGSEPG